MKLGQGSQPSEGETGCNCPSTMIPSVRPQGGSAGCQALGQVPGIHGGENGEDTASSSSRHGAPQTVQRSLCFLSTSRALCLALPGNPDCGSDVPVSQRKELGSIHSC